MGRNKSFPLTDREALAFLTAPAAAGFALVVADAVTGNDPVTAGQMVATTIVVLFGSYGAGVCLGLPLWLLLGSRIRLTPLAAMLGGGTVAAIPLLLLDRIGMTKAYLYDGRALIADYRFTAYGWHRHLVDLASIAAAGALGGIVFWRIVRPRRQPL